MQRFCVIGFPIAHSLSPIMHNAAFKKLGVPALYEATLVSPENLMDFISLARENYSGFNVTIPHKEKIIEYLDEVDEVARKIGAVNTVINHNGRLIGYNTDWVGFLEALKNGISDTESPDDFLLNKRVLVVGAGGAARAVSYGLVNSGAALCITNRTFEKAVQLVKEFGGDAVIFSQLKNIQPDIVVNVTSCGMAPHEKDSALPVDLWEIWSKKRQDDGQQIAPHVAFDCVYTPLITQFLKDAQGANFKTITGDTMLIEQAAAAFELFINQKAPTALMRAVLHSRIV